MNRGELLDEARSLIAGQRELEHGHPAITFEIIAGYWSVFLRSRLEVTAEPLQGHEVATMLALAKLARSGQGLQNADDYVDMLGYAALAGELRLCADGMDST